MTEPEALSTNDVTAAMEELHSDWTLTSGRLRRELTFGSFVDAFSFMTAIAIIAERIDHHPDWHNIERSITIELSTYDSNGAITANDFALATHIDTVSARFI